MKIAHSCALALVFLSTFTGDVWAQFSAPSSGLVAWWRGEGNANDSSGNGHDGTLLNGVAFDTGRFGQAFSFVGNLNRIFVPDANDFKLTNSLSISAWVFPKVDSWIVISRGGRSLSAYALEMDDTGNFVFSISGSSGDDQLTVPIAYNQWKQVTGTLDGSTGEMRLYFDGLLVAHKSTAVRPRAEIDSNPPPPAGVFIGNATDGGFPFVGLVDEVLLYSRALSAAEVQGLVNQGAPFVISQSTNQTVAVGDSALFRVSVSGAQPLSYQWSLGGNNLAGATTSNLTVTNVQPSQAGNYSVQVTNSLGATSSAPALLTVNTQQRSFVAPQPGLVAWWRGEGNGNDNSGNGHDGILRDGGGYAAGDFGQAFSFLGNHNRLLVPDSEEFNLTNSLTVAAWIYIKANSYAILQRANPGVSPYSLGLDETGNIVFALNSGQAGISAPIAKNQWKHVAATLDGSSGEMRLYIDGILVTSQTTSVRPASLDSSQQPLFSIGNIPYGGGFPFVGLIDEALVYSRALSSQEVRDLVQGPPAITLQPIDQIAWLGDTVAFTVAASGTAPLSYQWRLNGTNLTGATTSSLVFTNVQTAQAGSYSVQISNPAGSTNSASAVLTVNPQPYPFSVPSAGLVAWWRAEDNANDSSGNSHHGALFDGVTFDTGKFGQAFSMAGTFNRVLVPDSSDFKLTNSLSISSWIYPKADSWVVFQRAGGPLCPYTFQLDDAGHFQFTILDSSGTGDTVSAPIAYDQWTQVTATLDGATGNMRLYFNGSVVAQKLTSVRPFGEIDPSYQPTISIGNTPEGPFPYIGLIDELLVYSRALSLAEIQALALIPPSPPFITSQPASQTVTVGGTATFDVVAGALPPPSYQWLFNGAPLPGATSSSLTISNAQPSNAGTYAVVITNSLGSITSSNATLTVNFPPAIVRVLSTTNVGGSKVPVSVILTANGNETALGFSLNFTPSQLSYSGTALGSGATGATLLVNSNQTANGRLGIALSLPAGATFAHGDKQVVLVNFAGAVQTNNVSSVITFDDSPITRQLSDVNGNALPVNFLSGSVTLTANDFEADVSPRPTGDKLVTVTDWVLIGRFAARLESPANGSEFQRADCAPRSTLGNGNITVSDWVQAGRYVAGFDPLTPVGGPTARSLARPPLGKSGPGVLSSKRKLQVVNTTMAQGQPGSISINLRAQGDENGLGFSLSFDPSQFSFVGATLGSGAATATLNLNTIEAGSGRFAAVLSLPSGTSFPAGTTEVLRVRLQPCLNASGSIALSFLDQPVLRETSDAAANTLVTDYIDGLVTVNPSPALTISRDGVNLTLKWPDWASSYTLQELTGALSAAQAWSNVSATQTVVNGEIIVVVPRTASPKFYRLYKP